MHRARPPRPSGSDGGAGCEAAGQPPRHRPRRSSAASTYGSPVGPGSPAAAPSAGMAMSGVRPASWIQRLSGVSHFAIESRKPPASAVRSIHCWIVPLPNVVSPIERAAVGVLEGAGDHLARRGRPAVDEHGDADVVPGRDPARGRVGGDLRAVGRLLPEDRDPRR